MWNIKKGKCQTVKSVNPEIYVASKNWINKLIDMSVVFHDVWLGNGSFLSVCIVRRNERYDVIIMKFIISKFSFEKFNKLSIAYGDFYSRN